MAGAGNCPLQKMVHYQIIENLIRTMYGDDPNIKFLIVGVDAGYMEKNLFSKFPRIQITAIDKEKNNPFTEQEQERIKFINGLSAEVADSFQEVFDFIYLDGDHEYDGVMVDIAKYKPLVKFHGIFAGHDYNDRWGVKKALVDSNIKPIICPDLVWFTQIN